MANERGPKGDHGQHGDAGDQGITGAQGPIGERGEGVAGAAGERGPQGDTGARGEQGEHAPNIVRAFWAIVLIAFLVTCFGTFEAIQARNAAREAHTLAAQNRAGIHQLKTLARQQAEFRKLRAKQTTETALILCNGLNGLRKVIRHVVVPTRASLLKLSYYQQHPAELERAIAEGRKTALRFKNTDCATLPTTKKNALP